MPKHPAKDPVVEIGVPRGGDARTEGAIKGFVGVLLPGAGVAHQGKTYGRIVHLTVQSSLFALFKVALNVKLLAAGVYQFDLLAALFRRRHFERPAKAVSECEGRLHVPTVAEVDVVVGDGAFVESRCAGWVQRKVETGAGVSDL